MSLVARVLETLGLGADGFEPPDPQADQAVIDLLELVMLVDGSSAELERERIRAHLDAQDWPDGHNPYSYADEATARVRTALEDDAAFEALLASITDRLRSDDDRKFALAVVTELAGIDGVVDDREAYLISELRRRFAR